MLDKLEGHTKLAAATTGILAAYMYGVAYSSLSSYYGRFGLSPKDAGVTQSTLVAVAVTGFGFLAGMVLLVGLGGWTMRQALRSAEPRHFKRAKVAAAVASAAAIVGGAFLVRVASALGIAVVLAGLGAVFACIVVDPPNESEGSSSGPWRSPLIALALVAAAWVFYVEVRTATEQVAFHIIRDGGLERATIWQKATAEALGIRDTAVYGTDIPCAIVVAADGSTAWIMESPKETIVVRRVPRDSLSSRYSTVRVGVKPTGKPRSCWRDQ